MSSFARVDSNMILPWKIRQVKQMIDGASAGQFCIAISKVLCSGITITEMMEIRVNDCHF
jgi:hypothetical protein